MSQESASIGGLRVDLDDRGVGWLEIDRPDRMNALDNATSAALTETLHRWSTDDRVRVVVISGRGGAFSAGADVLDILESSSQSSGGFEADHARGVIATGSAMAQAVRAVRVPVIAAVDGAAAGIGASLALAADLVYATSRSYFLLAFINIGLMPDGGASMLVSASIGRARANALALLGEKLRADEAYAAGLVTGIAADRSELDRTVDAAVTKLIRSSTRALRLTKAALDAETMAGFDAAIERELDGQTELLQTSDFQAAIAAFAGPKSQG
ncbi:enoyl-CoA hydratase-related protein [Gordonia soli]|uniref:enoyl-CoA hydratase-related protein n=1 Tax=Gordonia soli TaxID=320799 RepID=UPI00058B48A4|nr:enoyl-CoA hydratase-related protein [Gordonia soli]